MSTEPDAESRPTAQMPLDFLPSLCYHCSMARTSRRSRLAALAFIILSVSCLFNHRPSAPAEPQGPESGNRDTSYRFRAVSTDADGNAISYQFTWGDGQTSAWSDFRVSGDSVSTYHAWSDTGVFDVRVRARDAYWAVTGWSPPHSFAVGVRGPKVICLPTGPDSTTRGDTCVFSAAAFDPDGDSVSLSFDWGNDTSGWSVSVAGGTNVAVAHVWNCEGLFGVRARARNSKGVVSRWTPPHSLMVSTRPPAVRNAPDAPDSVVRESTCAVSVTADDPDGDSVSLKLDWGDGDTSEWSGFVASGTAFNATHAWTREGWYCVRAIARDTKGALSSWSASDSIRVAPPVGNLKWHFAPGEYFTEPAIGSDGTVYAASYDGVFALNPDGSMRWHTLLSCRYLAAVALGLNDVIYIGSDDSLVALNSDGSRRWASATRCCAKPAIGLDGTVYVVCIDTDDISGVVAFNPDGSRRWRAPIPDMVEDEPAPTVASDGTIYFGSTGDYVVHALKPDGSTRGTSQELGGILSTTMIAADGTVYVGIHHDGGLVALNPDAQLKWRFAGTEESFFGGVSVGPDGTLYGGELCCDRTDYPDSTGLFAINPDGSTKWHVGLYDQDDAPVSAPTLCADGTIYMCCEWEISYALTPEGRVKWVWHTGSDWSPAVGSDGTVYIAADGIYALVGASPLADSPWPKYGHDLRNSGCAPGR